MWTDGRTDIFPPLILLGRLLEVDLKIGLLFVDEINHKMITKTHTENCIYHLYPPANWFNSAGLILLYPSTMSFQNAAYKLQKKIHYSIQYTSGLHKRTTSYSLSTLTAIFQVDLGWYQNVSILHFIGAKGDGGGGNNWSYKTCKTPVKMPPTTNQHPVFLQARCPSCRPTSSVKALK